MSKKRHVIEYTDHRGKVRTVIIDTDAAEKEAKRKPPKDDTPADETRSECRPLAF